jgi:SAM-dependent methyltransferase
MNTGMDPLLLDRLACPKCGRAIKLISKDELACSTCKISVSVENGKPIFTTVPAGMLAAPKLARGSKQGSRWRQANWHFLEKIVDNLPVRAVILDFGAGHGDFSEILSKRHVIALDVYPYEEIDIVCDLQKATPFKKASFDAIVLMNVLEHVQQPEKLMNLLAGLLRPDGLLVITVPFLLKLHQIPYDFYRYSHYQLKNIGLAAGLEINSIEGYYDPYLLMNESSINMWSYALTGMPFIARKLSRLLLIISSWLISIVERLSGRGHVGDPLVENSPYPIGYHVVFCVQKGKKK